MNLQGDQPFVKKQTGQSYPWAAQAGMQWCIGGKAETFLCVPEVARMPARPGKDKGQLGWTDQTGAGDGIAGVVPDISFLSPIHLHGLIQIYAIAITVAGPSWFIVAAGVYPVASGTNIPFVISINWVIAVMNGSSFDSNGDNLLCLFFHTIVCASAHSETVRNIPETIRNIHIYEWTNELPVGTPFGFHVISKLISLMYVKSDYSKSDYSKVNGLQTAVLSRKAPSVLHEKFFPSIYTFLLD